MLSAIFRKEAQRQLVYGKRQKALALSELVLGWSDTPENRFNLALARMNLREYEKALPLLESIHTLIPDHLFAGVTYGQCLLLAKRWQEAAEVYTKLLDENPDNLLLSKLLAMSKDPVGRDRFTVSLDLQYEAAILMDNKDYSAALELLLKAVVLTPEDAALYNNIGTLKLKLKHSLPEVMQAFSRAMQLSPDNDRYKRNYRKVWQRSQK